MKIVRIRHNQHKEAFFALLKREVEAIGRIEHVSRFSLRSKTGNYNKEKFTCSKAYSGADTVNSHSLSIIYAPKLV